MVFSGYEPIKLRKLCKSSNRSSNVCNIESLELQRFQLLNLVQFRFWGGKLLFGGWVMSGLDFYPSSKPSLYAFVCQPRKRRWMASYPIASNSERVCKNDDVLFSSFSCSVKVGSKQKLTDSKGKLEATQENLNLRTQAKFAFTFCERSSLPLVFFGLDI